MKNEGLASSMGNSPRGPERRDDSYERVARAFAARAKAVLERLLSEHQPGDFDILAGPKIPVDIQADVMPIGDHERKDLDFLVKVYGGGFSFEADCRGASCALYQILGQTRISIDWMSQLSDEEFGYTANNLTEVVLKRVLEPIIVVGMEKQKEQQEIIAAEHSAREKMRKDRERQERERRDRDRQDREAAEHERKKREREQRQEEYKRKRQAEFDSQTAEYERQKRKK